MANQSTGIIDILVGAAAVAASFIPGVGAVASGALAHFLISAGAGMVLSGLGTLIAGEHSTGFSSTMRSPIAPRRVCYGRCRVGGTLIYLNTWGGTGQPILDMVIVLATHPCQGGDLSSQSSPPASGTNRLPELLFNQKRIQIDRTKCFQAGTSGTSYTSQYAGESFSPLQQKVNILSAVRVGSIITFILHDDIPYLSPGDEIQITNLPPGAGNVGLTGNSTWIVSEIIGRGGGYYGVTFTVVSGGPAFNIFNFTLPGVGYATTLWADYGKKVYYEAMLGQQALGQTFVANNTGTPLDGNLGAFLTPEFPASLNINLSPQADLWTQYCSLTGMTAVFLRLHYDQTIFAAGLPQISFILYGKNDIYDPRLGAYGAAGTRAYTENPALCIADYLNAGAPLSAPWSISTTYSAGAVVAYVSGQGGVGVDYVSVISSNTGNQPDTSTTIWFPVTSITAPQWWQNLPPGTPIAYTPGQLVQYPAGPGNITSGAPQYICLTSNSSAVTPDISPTRWAVLPIYVHPLLKWGYSLNYGDSSDIPVTQLTASANICDQAVTLAEGGTEPRYTCNGQFDLDMRRGEVLQNMLTSCAGRLTIVDGQYVVQPGYYVGPGLPPLELHLAPMCSGAVPVRWKPTCTVRELYNGVKGTYISPANKWQSSDFPLYAQDYLHGYNGPPQYAGDINVAADGGDRRWLDVHLPFTISSSMAQRIAKIELLRRRHFGTATLSLNLSGYQLVPLDIFEATFPFLGWTNELVEVQAVRFVTGRQSVDGMEVPTILVEVDLQTIDPSVYVWNVDEELTPQGYQTASLPTETVVETVPFPWSPGYIAPLDGDAIWLAGALGPASFGITPDYVGDENGTLVPTLAISGYLPINSLDTGLFGPLISITYSTTGGSLPAGTYTVGLSAYDAGAAPYKNVFYLDFATVTIPLTSPPTDTNSITVKITWSSGDFEGDVYLAVESISQVLGQQLHNVGEYESRLVLHFNQNVSSTSTTSVTITTLDQSQPGGPDDQFDHFGVIWNPIVHGGVWAQQVQNVTGTSGSSPGTITIADPNNGTTANQYAGCTVSLLAYYEPGVAVPILNMPVLSNTASAGVSPPPNQFVLTIGPNADSVSLPSLLTLLPGDGSTDQKGDLLVMRYNATFTPTSFTDPNFANTYYPGGATGIEAGHLAYVLTGPDAGDVQTVASVTAIGGLDIQINIAGTWNVTPNTGDLVIIVSGNQPTEWLSPAFISPNKLTPAISITPNVQNLAEQTWLVQVRTKNAKDQACLDFMAPYREVYFFGAQGTTTS